MIVVDASVIVSASLEDEFTAMADRVVDVIAETGAVAPGNFIVEVVNALAKAERRGRIEQTKSEVVLAEILNLPIQVEAPSPHIVLTAARTYGLTAYDAAYLALAIENQISLATVDTKLRAAARKAKCEWRPG